MRGEYLETSGPYRALYWVDDDGSVAIQWTGDHEGVEITIPADLLAALAAQSRTARGLCPHCPVGYENDHGHVCMHPPTRKYQPKGA